jgi:outer membrane immunogenic protein
MLKNLLFAGTATVLMIGTAQAADIIEPTAYDWTGAYIGLQAGYAWGNNDVSPDVEPLQPAIGAFDAITLDPPDDGDIDIDGFVGGAHLGYNFQADSLVFGLEGDIEYADLSGDTDIFFSSDDEEPIGEAEQSIDWLGSLRLRLGYAMDRALIYGTGGLAVGGVDMKVKIDETGSESESETAWGWTIGGGLEYAFTDDLSARIEYRYTDLGKTEVSTDDLDLPGDFEFENAFHAVRVGLSWHFNSL